MMARPRSHGAPADSIGSGGLLDLDRPFRARPDRLVHHLLQMRGHLSGDDLGIAVVVDVEHLGAHAHAHPVAPAAVRVHGDLHARASSTTLNSRCSPVIPRRMNVRRTTNTRTPAGSRTSA